MFRLGWLNENGLGVTRDYQVAITWYRHAAAVGDDEAKKCLAELSPP